MVQIVDQWGNPIQKETLTEPQTSRLGSLYHEFAEHPSRGLTPPKLARILEQAEQGDLLAQFDLFDDMEEKDAHILTEMSKRKRALMGLDWDIEPPLNATAQEKRATELVKELLKELPDFQDMIFDLADAIGKGFAALEHEWSLQQKLWMPVKSEHRPQRWFMVPHDARNDLRLRDGSPDGEELQPFGWMLHIHRARSGYITRAGLHRTLAWPYLFKNYAIRDLAEFLEIYGLPLRLGTYPPGASDREKATLLQAVMSIGHDAAGIIPQGMQIDFKEAAKGTNDPFDAMIAWCERSQSKAIVGATLTTEVGSTGGNRALGEVHQDVAWDLTISDARQLQGTITRDLIYPLAALNVGISHPSRSPRFKFDTDQGEDLKLYAESLPKLVGVGMKIPEPWARGKLRIPDAQDGEDLLETRRPESPFAQLRMAALRREAEEATITDRQIARLETETAPAVDAMIDTVRALLDQSQSLEDFRDRLLEVWPDMDSDQFADVMREALVAAQLAGRFDILEEAGGSG